MADNDLAGPPPREAIDYLRRKGIRAGWDYRDVWREEHGHAFTVANMMVLDLLSDVRDSITAAQEEGTTKARWKQDMTATLRKRGWWGRKEEDAKAARAIKDELRRAEAKGDDPRKIAALGDDLAEREAALDLYISRRLDTIWRVNLGQAAQAGAWERGQRSASHPYILYRIGPSKVHREQHEAWDGLLLAKDDPFWSVANPKNGWGCKCYTRFVSEAQRRRYLDKGVAAPVVGDGEPGKKAVKTASPTLHPQQYRNPRTGEIHTGYRAIDPGFERNPGVGRGEQIGEQYAVKDDRLAKDTVPQGPKYMSDRVSNQLSGHDARRVRDTLSAIGLVHGAAHKTMRTTNVVWDPGIKDVAHYNPKTPRIAVQTQLAPDYEYSELLAAHELGHMIDHDGLPGAGYASKNLGAAPPEFLDVFRAIQDAPLWTAIQQEVAGSKAGTPYGDYVRYRAKPEEWWARAYAQWVAWKSGSEAMKAQIDSGILGGNKAWRLTFWGHDEFLPIAVAIDTMMESLGWLERQ